MITLVANVRPLFRMKRGVIHSAVAGTSVTAGGGGALPRYRDAVVIVTDSCFGLGAAAAWGRGRGGGAGCLHLGRVSAAAFREDMTSRPSSTPPPSRGAAPFSTMVSWVASLVLPITHIESSRRSDPDVVRGTSAGPWEDILPSRGATYSRGCIGSGWRRRPRGRRRCRTRAPGPVALDSERHHRTLRTRGCSSRSGPPRSPGARSLSTSLFRASSNRQR